MIFLRFKEKIPLRIAEWLGAIAMVLIGLYLVIWPSAFQRAGLSGFQSIAPVGVWVTASLLLGTARVAALVVNGHKPELSAPVRCIVAALGVGLFSSISAGYSMSTNEYGPPLATVLAFVLMVGELFNTTRSAQDVFEAYRSRSLKHWNGSQH